jgi:hypothetical protein
MNSEISSSGGWADRKASAYSGEHKKNNMDIYLVLCPDRDSNLIKPLLVPRPYVNMLSSSSEQFALPFTGHHASEKQRQSR